MPVMILTVRESDFTKGPVSVEGPGDPTIYGVESYAVSIKPRGIVSNYPYTSKNRQVFLCATDFTASPRGLIGLLAAFMSPPKTLSVDW